MATRAEDQRWMDRALSHARAALGTTAPNPSVGCVVVRDGTILAEAATGAGGHPHAEEAALDAAGGEAAGATAYVTLEPCARRSRPGAVPCTDRLVAAQVARVVVACRDPHPNAAGAGLDRLREAGVIVEEGLRRAEAEALNAGFFHRVRTGSPLIIADADHASYDADGEAIGLDPSADLERQLRALGEAGLTRVRVAPGSDLARALAAAGILHALDDD